MRYRVGPLLSVAILVASLAVPLAYSADYTPTRLFFTVYSDGVVSVDYTLDVDPTLVKVSIPLLGSLFRDVLVVDQDGIPLDYSASGSAMVVDNLGSTSVAIAYTTPDLTSKIGSLWVFNASSPATSSIILPLGATVTSFSSVPLEVGTLNNRPYISMPAGQTEVEYILGVVGTKEHALVLLKDAEATISNLKIRDLKVSEAEAVLSQAYADFNAGKYPEAEQLATSAREKAQSIESAAASADNALKTASFAISAARSEGRTSGLSDAENLLQAAQGYYTQGDYGQALKTANDAYQAALAAKAEANYLIPVAVGGAIVIVIAVLLLYGRRKAEPITTTKTTIDLQSIFRKNPELRMDDKEVLRFIADSGGEVFANDIRERFDLPRTSAWRMFRRMIGMGIIEERKIGGQSLIRISKMYRGGGEE